MVGVAQLNLHARPTFLIRSIALSMSFLIVQYKYCKQLLVKNINDNPILHNLYNLKKEIQNVRLKERSFFKIANS